MSSSEFLLSLLFLSYLLPSVYSTFTYKFGAPGSCDNLEITWTGGQAPFELVLVPIYGTPRTFKIPDTAATNGQGVYSVQMNFPQNQKLFFVMSDATGFASGGTSVVTQVGPSVSGNTCNTTDPGVDFFFNLNSALIQCGTYVFDGYDGAVQPVTITGFIPGGNTFNLTPPAGPPSYNWNADLLAGTSVVFAMSDSKGRNGGSSSILLVGESGDNSCINSTTPSSTSNPPSPISTSPGGPSASPPGQNDKKNGGSNSIAIALGSLGGVLALGLVFALIFFYFQRKRKRQNDHSEGSYKFRGNGGPRRMSLDLEEPRPVDDTHDDQTLSHITPFSESHAASSSDYLRPTREDLQGADLIPPRPGPPSSNARSKASQAGSFRQPRYVVHTDVEDAIPEDNDQEVIELPPTYSERRGPAPPSTAGSSLYTEYHSPPPP